MMTSYRTIQNPTIDGREITYLFTDNKIDIPSSRFFAYQAKYGGRGEQKASSETLKTMAIEIGELFRHFDEMGVTWRTASQAHVKAIRNHMTCLDKNDNKDYSNYTYEPILNNTMNRKLGTWFKFYDYMKSIGESFDMHITTKRVKKWSSSNSSTLSHLNHRRTDTNKSDYIEVWDLRLPPDPIRYSFHALSRTEFDQLERHLGNIDIVYKMIAVLAVSTGLRLQALLDFSPKSLKTYFKYLNSGLSLNDTVPMDYIAKGGYIKQFDLKIETIQRLQTEYMTRVYRKRKKLHSDRSIRLKSCKYEEDAMWITETGKAVNKDDLRKAFRIASEKMARETHRITPHWLRHTFATWTLMDFADEMNINLGDKGIINDINIIRLIADKLGHKDEVTTLKYIMTALKLKNIGVHKGTITSFLGLKKNKTVQELVRKEAMAEFGDEFNPDRFDPLSYALARGLAVDDSWGQGR